jgi:flagellar motor component MotA
MRFKTPALIGIFCLALSRAAVAATTDSVEEQQKRVSQYTIATVLIAIGGKCAAKDMAFSTNILRQMYSAMEKDFASLSQDQKDEVLENEPAVVAKMSITAEDCQAAFQTMKDIFPNGIFEDEGR